MAKARTLKSPTIISSDDIIHPIAPVQSSAKLATIVENPSLVKDLTSHAILNRDHSAYEAAVKFRQYSKQSKETVIELSDRVAQLENLVRDLISQIGTPLTKGE